jgi:CDGSH-type Zn-finger protein
MAQPVKVSLEAGKSYHYCTCGKSSDGVLCDGAHKGSGFTPKAFSVKQSKDYYLCSCKKSANEPFCDGSHK